MDFVYRDCLWCRYWFYGGGVDCQIVFGFVIDIDVVDYFVLCFGNYGVFSKCFVGFVYGFDLIGMFGCDIMCFQWVVVQIKQLLWCVVGGEVVWYQLLQFLFVIDSGCLMMQFNFVVVVWWFLYFVGEIVFKVDVDYW